MRIVVTGSTGHLGEALVRVMRDLGHGTWAATARLSALPADADIRSPLAQRIGRKGYHDRTFGNEPYPV